MYTKDLHALTQLRVRGLRPNTAYHFQVMAQNQVGDSPWSAPSAAMKTEVAPPGQCGQVRYISGNCRDGLAIFWTPADSYGLPITRFDLRVSKALSMKDATSELHDIEVSPAKVENAEPDDMQATVTMDDCFLIPGGDHFCQVRCWNRVGVGSWSPVSAAMRVSPETPAAPDAPWNFTALPSSIIVRWSPPHCLGSPLTGYRLRYAETRSMKDPVDVGSLLGLETERPVTQLESHKAYYFQVAGVNAVGQGPWSAASQPSTTLQAPPPKLEPPFLVSAESHSITVGFNEPSESDPLRKPVISSYMVLYAAGKGVFSETNPAGFRKANKAVPEGTPCGGLMPGKSWEFRVVAINDFGQSQPSAPAYFTTDAGVPERPKPPEFLEAAPWSIKLFVAPNDDHGSPITHYIIQLECPDKDEELKEIGPLEVTEVGASGAVISTTVDGLIPGTSYRFCAAAQNAVGRSLWSAALEDVQTLPSVPFAITELEVCDIRPHSYRLRWEPPEDNGAEVEKYTIAWMCNAPPDSKTARGRLLCRGLEKGWREAETTNTCFTCEDCLQACSSVAKVAAHNKMGMGPFSKVIEVTLGDDVPFAPAQLTWSQVSFTSARTNWCLVFDGGSEVTGYWVHFMETETDGRPEDQRDQGEIFSDPKKSFQDINNLCPKREYVFRVAAENAFGIGPYSQFSSAQRLFAPQPPDPPGKPVLLSATVTTLEVKVQHPDSNGSPITEQVFYVSHNRRMPECDRIEIKLPSHASISRPPGAPSRRSTKLKGPTDSSNTGGTDVGDGQESPPEKAALRISGELRLQRAQPVQCVYELPRLVGGHTYFVACASRNSVGLGPMGPVSDPMLTKQDKPLPILELAFTGKDTSSVTVTWDEPDCQGSEVLRYEIRCSPDEDMMLVGNRDPDEEVLVEDRLAPVQVYLVNDIEDRSRPSFRFKGLLPGVTYFASVRSYNALGWSPWAQAIGSCKTLPMPPMKMQTPQALPDKRTKNSVTFKLDLPDPRGAVIHNVELRYVSAQVEQGHLLDPGEEQFHMILSGKHESVPMDQATGRVPSEYTLVGLEDHAMVVAIARAVNDAGVGEWSDAPVRDPDNLDVECVAEPAAPDPPKAPSWVIGTVESKRADFTVELTNANGLLYTRLGFKLFAGPRGKDLDELGPRPLGHMGQAPWREWEEDVPREELLQVLQNRCQICRRVDDLDPGTVYGVQVSAANPVGFSEWSVISPVTRTKPEKPTLRGPLTLEDCSPVHIGVKWIEPYSNGAPIAGYGIRYTDKEGLPPEQWTVLSEEYIDNAKTRSTIIDEAITIDLRDLVPNKAHYMQMYARNWVGSSGWSETSTFYTRPSPPARVDLPKVTSVQPKEALVEWEAPDDFGAAIKRYEILSSRNIKVLKWARLISEKLWWAPSLEVIFGLFGLVDEQSRADGPIEAGRASLLDLSESNLEAFFVETSLVENTLNRGNPYAKLGELLPGKEYFSMIRAVNERGNGKWSQICNMLTPPTFPRQPQQVRIETVTTAMCRVSFVMPYDNGNRIYEADLKVERVDGPLADDQIHPGTREPHPHHRQAIHTYDPWAIPLEEELHTPGEEQRFCFSVPNLLPGTNYQVSWGCRNECGIGAFSEPESFKTKADRPDKPGSMFTSEDY